MAHLLNSQKKTNTDYRKHQNNKRNNQSQRNVQSRNEQLNRDHYLAQELQQRMIQEDLQMMRNALQQVLGDEINIQQLPPEQIVEIYNRLALVMNQNDREDEYERLLLLDENNVPRGASQDQIKNLRIVEYNDKIKQGDSDCPNCSICIDEFEKGDKVISLKCNHIYHKDCILKWFEKSKFCPICRSELK